VQFEIIHRWTIDGDRITAFQSFNNDQRRYDAFHGVGDPVAVDVEIRKAMEVP